MWSAAPALASKNSPETLLASRRLVRCALLLGALLAGAALLALPAGAAVPGALGSVTVTPSTRDAGATGALDFGFALENALPAGGVVSITLPGGWAANSGATSTATFGNCAATAAPNTGSATALAFAHDAGCAANATLLVRVSNVRNPDASGPYTIPLRTQTPGFAAIDLGSAATDVRGALTVRDVVPASLVSGAVTSYRFDLTTTGAWPRDGNLTIAFPAAGATPGPSDIQASGATGATGTDCVTGGLSVVAPAAIPAAQVVTVKRLGDGSVCPPGSSFSITVGGIRNPGFAWRMPVPAVWTSTITPTLIDSNRRAVADGVTDGTATVGSATAAFSAADLGATVAGAGIPAGARIVAVPSATTATISSPATASATGVALTVTRPVTRAVATATAGLGDTTLATPAAAFTATDVGSLALGGGLAAGTTVTAVPGATSAAIAPAATGAVGGVTLARATLASTTSGAVAAITISPTMATGATGAYTFRFVTANPLPADGRIVLTFPADYADMASLGSVPTLLGPTGCATGTLSASVAGTTVTVARGGAAAETCPAGSLALTLTGVRNPPYVILPGIAIATSAAASLAPTCPCAIDAGVSGATASVDLAPAAFTPATGISFADSPARSQASRVSNYRVEFTTTNPWPADGRLAVAFPSGYGLAGATAALAGCDGTLTVAAGAPAGTLLLNRAGGAVCPAGRPVAVTLTGIANPPYSGPSGAIAYCTARAGFAATASCGAPQTIDAGSAQVTLTPAILTVTGLAAGSDVAGALTGYTLTFGITNTWPANGRLQVAFPAGYNLTGLHGTAAPGGPSTDCASGLFAASASGQVVTVTRSGGAACPAGTSSIEVTVNGVRNPPVSGAAAFAAGAASALNGAGVVMDQSIAAPAPIAIVPAPFASLGTPTATGRAAGAAASWTFPVTLTNPWPAGGSMRFDLTGFGFGTLVASATGCTGALTATPSIGAGALPDYAFVTRSTGTCPAGSALAVTIGGLTNPPASGLPAIAVETRQGTAAIDRGTFPAATVEPGALTQLSLLPDSRGASATTTYHHQFTLANPWPATGVFQVTLPPGFTVAPLAPPTASLAGCAGTLAIAAIAGGTVTFSRAGGADCAAGTAVTIDVTGVRNADMPAIAAFSFRTCNGWAGCGLYGSTIDAGSVTLATGAVSPFAVTAADPSPGMPTRLDLAAALLSSWPADGVARITFPTGFGLPVAATATATGCASGAFAAAVAAPVVTVTRSGGSDCAPGAVTLGVAAITNPPERGASLPIALDFLDGAGNVLQSHAGQLFVALPATRLTAIDTTFSGVAANRVLALQATARDATGMGVPGIPVAWTIDSGSGTLVSGASTVSDGSGVATMLFRLNGTAGAVVKAAVAGLSGSPVSFGVNGGGLAVPGALASLALNASASSIGADAGIVSLTARGATASGASLGDVTAATTFTVAPDGTCVGSVCTIRKAGPHTITATKSGIQATAGVTVTPGAARAVTALPVAGTARLAPGSAVTLQAKVTDLHGNAVPNSAVAWAVAGGGGTLSAPTSTTGTDGIASVTLTTGATAGANAVTASRTGATPATFTVTTAAAGAIQAVTAALSGTPAGAPQTLQARVTDLAGAPVAGATVSWLVRSGPGALSAATSVTDANGLAAAALTATATGTTAAEASVAGAPAPAAFTVATVPGPVERVEVSPATATAARGQAQAYTVRATDRYGNEVANAAAGAFLSIGPDGSCSGTSCQGEANGPHTVSATVGGRTGTATLDVADASRDGTDVSGQANASPPSGLLAVALGLLGAAVAVRRRAA